MNSYGAAYIFVILKIDVGICMLKS